MPEITTAMVMAAGLGLRMRPLTDTLPKPLVRLCDKPLIDYALDRLGDAGVETAVVNVHHMADQLERHLAGRTRPAVVISDERGRLLDTGGGAARMLATLGPGAFFVINSDSVWLDGVGDSLMRLAGGWDEGRMDCLILCASTVASRGYDGPGDFVMDEGGRLARRAEGRVAPFVNTGAYIVHPRLFTDVPDGPFSMNLLWDRAIEAGRLYGIRHDGVWMHVGSPAALAEAEALMSEPAV
jgi:N-acetyl-alpha-D-muramate 1-phosphate uridylyltransferase